MKYLITVTIILAFNSFYSQTIINAYAKVSNINLARTTLTLTNVNQTNHTFVTGEKIIIMQMQDETIGTNIADNVNFGDLNNIRRTGRYEIRTISSRSPATGTPTTIVLSAGLTNGYFNINNNSSVQIITFRNMGTNYTTTVNITGLAWNGNVGGVIGMEVANTLTLNHSILADAIGFRGGAVSSSAGGGCQNSIYRTNSTNQGYKGEGIFKPNDANHTNGRGKILNGGGGGNEHNAGGGGGGNFSDGGSGGYGWNCNASSNSGGIGGIALPITSDRIFMGGGGGGGQQNNGVASNGGNGGGIILLKADRILTNTVCSSAIRISANRQTTSNTGNDGAGGAGAGGSIVLQVNTFSASSTCPLTISGNGGNGGNVNDGGTHGGGGGGGQGVVIFSIPQPTMNITTTTARGTAGRDNSGGTVTGTSGGGTANTGTITAATSPLPIELLHFTGEPIKNKTKLTWATATEVNNNYFTVEKSADGITFTELGEVKAVGNSKKTTSYELYDYNPFAGINYYRLKQTDFDEKYTYSRIISLTFENTILFSIYPNPANEAEPIYASFENLKSSSQSTLHIYDIAGKIIISKTINTELENELNTIKINDIELAKGVYMIRFENGTDSETKKIIIY